MASTPATPAIPAERAAVGLVLSALPARGGADAVARAALWHNLVHRIGHHVPLVFVHDLGRLLADGRPPRLGPDTEVLRAAGVGPGHPLVPLVMGWKALLEELAGVRALPPGAVPRPRPRGRRRPGGPDPRAGPRRPRPPGRPGPPGPGPPGGRPGLRPRRPPGPLRRGRDRGLGPLPAHRHGPALPGGHQRRAHRRGHPAPRRDLRRGRVPRRGPRGPGPLPPPRRPGGRRGHPLLPGAAAPARRDPAAPRDPAASRWTGSPG